MAEPMALSYSKLDTWLQCERRFFFRHILKVPEPNTGPKDVGLVVHGVMESALRAAQGTDTDVIPWEWLENALRAYWGATKRPVEAREYQDTLEMLRRWQSRVGVRWRSWLSGRAILGVEQRWAMKMGGVDMSGVFDLVLGSRELKTIWVLDWKTGRAILSRDEIAADMQMDLYALAALKLHPWAERVISVYELMRQGYAVQHERDPNLLVELEDWISIASEQIERRLERGQDAFEAKPSGLCAYCAAREGCPGLADDTPRDIDETDVSAVALEYQRLGGIASALEARRDHLKGAIKTHIELTGENVVAGGKQYTLEPNKRRVLRGREALAVLREVYPDSTPLDWVDGLVADLDELARLLSDGPERQRALEALEEAKEVVITGDRLTPRKAPGGAGKKAKP